MIDIQQGALSTFSKNAFIFLQCVMQIFRSVGNVCVEFSVKFLIFFDNSIHIECL